MDRTRPAARLGSMLAENLGLKLMALVIAVVLFSLVRGSGTVQRSVNIPVTFQLPPAMTGQPVLLTPLPDRVRLTVRGPSSIVGALRADVIDPIQLDLRDGHRPSVRLDPALVQLPVGVSFVSFAPDALELRWDLLVSRSLPVRASVVGGTAPGTRVASATEVEPDRVQVAGPALYVNPLSAVHTDPLDATALGVGRYERRVDLEHPRAGVSYDFTGTVRVGFDVVPVVAERRFERLPVVLLPTAAGPAGAIARLTLRPPVVDVVVRGTPGVVDRLLPNQVVPVAEVSDAALPNGTQSVTVRVRPLPEGVEVAGVTPGDVLVVPAR